MLNPHQKRQVSELVKSRLDEAEQLWGKFGSILVKSALAMDSISEHAEVVPSKIPGHKEVSSDDPQCDDFIALVADMRDSTKHLQCAIGTKHADVSQLQRVFYETSALLPALALTASFENGNVTEYLGDGVLALFQVPKDYLPDVRKRAYKAAKNCVGDSREIVNEALKARYRLPALDIGVGLANSKAIVMLVGLDGDKHPKAIGECIYRATKLSSGRNEVAIDEFLRKAWPSSKGGTLRFNQRDFKGVSGYAIENP